MREFIASHQRIIVIQMIIGVIGNIVARIVPFLQKNFSFVIIQRFATRKQHGLDVVTFQLINNHIVPNFSFVR